MTLSKSFALAGACALALISASPAMAAFDTYNKAPSAQSRTTDSASPRLETHRRSHGHGHGHGKRGHHGGRRHTGVLTHRRQHG
ncbi:MAG: hypothetical protein ACHP84_03345 [Caulobacterales bacterium]